MDFYAFLRVVLASTQFGYLNLLNSYNEKHVTDLCGIVYRICLFEVTLCIGLFMVHDQH